MPHALIAYLAAILRDRRTWEKVAATAVQTGVIVKAAVDVETSVLVGAIAGAVNLVLLLIPAAEAESFWGKVGSSSVRTWLSAFIGAAIAATPVTGDAGINWHGLSAAALGGWAAGLAVVKAAVGKWKNLGDPDDPAWAPAPEAPAPVDPPADDQPADGPAVLAASFGTPPSKRRRKKKPGKPKSRRAKAGVAAAVSGAVILAGGTAALHDSGGPSSGIGTAVQRDVAADVQVLALTNHLRAAAGCKAVAGNVGVAKAAAAKTASMLRTGDMTHAWPDGVIWWKHVMRFYGDPGGENIAEGFPTAAAVMTAWRNSPEHYRNIVNCSFRVLGVAHEGGWWVQEFGY